MPMAFASAATPYAAAAADALHAVLPMPRRSTPYAPPRRRQRYAAASA